MVSPTLRPLPGPAASQFVSLVAGKLHYCGLTADGAAYCAGDNHFGTLGDDQATSASGSKNPVPVHGGLLFDSLTSGPEFTCGVLRSNHSAFCWVSMRLFRRRGDLRRMHAPCRFCIALQPSEQSSTRCLPSGCQVCKPYPCVAACTRRA